jgi:hypothetical protein
MQRPIERPGLGAETRPGVVDRLPSNPTTRPGVVDRLPGNATTLPGVGDRLPGATTRPGIADRPDWVNNAGNRNPVINNRPAWVNIDRDTNIQINNRWNNAFTRPGNNNWWNRPANRMAYWHGWSNGVRHGWSHYGRCHNWYTRDWWRGHRHGLCGWHYHWRWGVYPPGYWWGVPTWARVTSWFIWAATPPPVWQQPVYYDYGTGGNVIYQDNSVYIGGEQVATADEFAESAAALATVEPPANDEQAEAAEWLPLGTFIVTSDEKDIDSPRTVQLAVSKEGIVSGTLYNSATDEAQSVQGQVDKETQRVAVRVGESDSLVIETGLYNLTQDEVPLLVHFGTERTENWLLVRLPAEDDASATAAQ